MNRLPLFFTFLSLGLVGCGNNEINEISDNTIELQILQVDTNGVPISAVSITDKSEIKDVLKVITNSEAPTFKCGHNFELHCKTFDSKIVVIELNSDKLCANASFLYNGEIKYRYLDIEGLNRLKTLLN